MRKILGPYNFYIVYVCFVICCVLLEALCTVSSKFLVKLNIKIIQMIKFHCGLIINYMCLQHVSILKECKIFLQTVGASFKIRAKLGKKLI